MTFADTAQLGLFEGVAFEAMRMRTVARLIFLEANESTELAGIEIPKGTLGVPADQACDPRRQQLSGCQGFQAGAMGWSTRKHSRRTQHEGVLAFRHCPRFCSGRYLATLEMKMVLAMLVRNFSVEHAEDPEITQEVFAFTIMPSRLRLRLRAMA
jgi:cytochrome P450